MGTLSRFNSRIACICFWIVAVALGACSPNWELTHSRDGFSAASIGRIYVMQPVDGRGIVKENQEFPPMSRDVKRGIASTLKSMGYTVEVDPGVGPSNLTAGQVAFASASQIKSFGPAGERWVLVPVIENSHVPEMLNYTEMTAYVFDKDSGLVVWEGSGLAGHADALGDLVLKSGLRKTR